MNDLTFTIEPQFILWYDKREHYFYDTCLADGGLRGGHMEKCIAFLFYPHNLKNV